METEVKLVDTIKDKVERRNREIEIISQILELSKQLKTSCTYELSELIRFPTYLSDDKTKKIQSYVDAIFWRQILDEFQVEKYMTSVDKEKFSDKLHNETPCFEYDTALSMVMGLMTSKDAMATNLIKKVYENITNISFKSSTSKKFEKRIQKKVPKTFRASILYTYGKGLPSYISESTSNFSLISDLERALYLCDDKLQPDYNASIISLASDCLRDGRTYVTSPYLDLEFFKNGNVKITITNQKALDTLNHWGLRGDRLDHQE
jgi:hypothetical protein